MRHRLATRSGGPLVTPHAKSPVIVVAGPITTKQTVPRAVTQRYAPITRAALSEIHWPRKRFGGNERIHLLRARWHAQCARTTAASRSRQPGPRDRESTCPPPSWSIFRTACRSSRQAASRRGSCRRRSFSWVATRPTSHRDPWSSTLARTSGCSRCSSSSPIQMRKSWHSSQHRKRSDHAVRAVMRRLRYSRDLPDSLEAVAHLLVANGVDAVSQFAGRLADRRALRRAGRATVP
jgi:hypothetical protein